MCTDACMLIQCAQCSYGIPGGTHSERVAPYVISIKERCYSVQIQRRNEAVKISRACKRRLKGSALYSVELADIPCDLLSIEHRTLALKPIMLCQQIARLRIIATPRINNYKLLLPRLHTDMKKLPCNNRVQANDFGDIFHISRRLVKTRPWCVNVHFNQRERKRERERKQEYHCGSNHRLKIRGRKCNCYIVRTACTCECMSLRECDLVNDRSQLRCVL